MKWLLTEFKKHFDSWLLIIFASVIVVVVVSIILIPLSKKAIFPKNNERHDIDTLYIGQMKDFCPKEFAANPGREEFESCVPKLNINKMVEVKIPTFKDTIDRAPNLPYIMKHSSDPKIRMASNYFKEGNYFVVGIKIPEKLFSNDGKYIKNGKINDNAVNYNVLAFKAVRFGITCINSSCNNFLKSDAGFTQIPLIRNNGDKGNTVWVFGLDNTSPHGLWLENGVLISKSSTLEDASSFYNFALDGRAMFVSIAFIALFLVSLPFAIYLRKFSDYPAFSYFAGSTALWFISERLYLLFPELQGVPYRLFSIWITLNFLLSILVLNLAYARFKSVLKKKYFLISHTIILGLILVAYIHFKNLGAIIAVWDKLELIFAITSILFVLIPLGYGIYKLSTILRGQRLSNRLDYKRRIKELVLYSMVWVIFCSSYIRFAILSLGTGNVSSEMFFSTSTVVPLFLIGIMLYYTQSKEVTHMAEALSKQAQFMAHDIRRPFSQIKLVLSMFNSLSSDQKMLDTAKQGVETSIKRVESMLSDLIESGRVVPLNIKALSVKNLIEQAFNQIELNSNPVRIDVVKFIDDTLMISGDEQKLVRCFVNILENAVDAVRENHCEEDKGLIEISSKIVNVEGADCAEIIVANNGPTIDENDMPRLFESFFTKGKSKGTGLGLAFTHRTISQHNGSTKARNKKKNDGVEFVIMLPAIKKIASAKDKLQILLIDDDTVYRSLVKTLIEGDETLTQVDVFEAASVKEAITVTNKRKITHALVDIDLNDNEKGFAYLDYIHNKKLDIVCAIHTNKYLGQDMQEKIDQHNVCYISKPLDTNKLHSFICKNKNPQP